MSFPGENFNHVGRTMIASVASLPHLTCCHGSSGGGCRLLSSENFRFYACLRSVASSLFGLHRSSSDGCFTVPLASGYFATILLWRMLSLHHYVGWGSSRAIVLPSWLVGRVDALPPLLCCRPLHLNIIVHFSRLSCIVIARLVGSGEPIVLAILV